MRKAIDIINWDKDDMFNSSPVLKCTLNGIPVTLLIDSGASICFLDENFLKLHPELNKLVKRGKYSYTVDSIKGSKKITKILQTKNLTVLATKYDVEFKVANLNLPIENKEFRYVGIVGFDFMIQNKITLNFKDFMITDSK